MYGVVDSVDEVAINGMDIVRIVDSEGKEQGYAKFNELGECIDGNVGNNYEISVTFGTLSLVERETAEDNVQTPSA